MSDKTSNEDLVRRYLRAANEDDRATMSSCRHTDWSVEWPQSGEHVTSDAAMNAIVEHYPGGAPRGTVERVVGSEDRWVMTPANVPIRVMGSGDFWWGESLMSYPDGRVYHSVFLIELQDGLIYRETVYWAEPFDPPEWRREWVELKGHHSGPAS